MKKKKKPNTLPEFKGNHASALAMRKVLERRLKQLRKEAQTTLLDIMNSDEKNKVELIEKAIAELLEKWNLAFNKLGRELAKRMMTQVAKHIDVQFIKINKDFGIKRGKQHIDEVKQAIMHENITLIKSIPTDVLNKYSNILTSSIGRFDQAAVVKQLSLVTALNAKRIKLIARDQTAKAMNRYHMIRAQGLGFEYYVWKTVKDERVSKGDGGHKILQDRIYKYNNPTAIVDTYGTPGHPGQRVNCRCRAATLVKFDTTHLKLIKDKNHGDYYIEQDLDEEEEE